jgi:hypothetical protein
MAKEMSLTECFAVYGAKPKNPRWSWSARSETEAVITLWQDGIKSTSWDYNSNPRGKNREVLTMPAVKERYENLLWAQENAGGRFRVVVAVAKDTAASPRAIARCFPREDITMELTSLDQVSGDFTARRVL